MNRGDNSVAERFPGSVTGGCIAHTFRFRPGCNQALGIADMTHVAFRMLQRNGGV